mmetsp:Transcript_13573/g.20651  ORF Transcript_13573/g.20651 Transcript_13573/m.20651 type:complete len:426 (+) Transcript_13573:195-1472(+)|eukprot:CAMPEP_0178908940 /NCGR_PEP_ID=MMETSP0786-20121207/8208_1 /TAXON_ID=186022 /ORGANISM="Thalassionema frauenfeldii, Strain CCMP 1798" /LENGTH=425 /DNA_ID=CAMNT_0020580911 /DNA_START=125 /DNA_END=1402 /DNA_ORIENTATION=-
MANQCISCLFIAATVMFMSANILNMAALFVCDFVLTEDYNGPENPDDEISGGVRGFGMYRIQDHKGVCRLISFSGGIFDPDTGDWIGDSVDTVKYWTSFWINVARFGGSFAALIGFFTWLGMWCAFCCGCFNSRCCRMGYAAVAITCCFSASCMFFVYESSSCNSGCALGTGGILAIVSIILYFITGILCCCIPKSESVEEEPKEETPKGATTKDVEDPEDPAVPVVPVPVVPPPSEPETEPENEPDSRTEVLVEKTREEDGTIVVKKTTTHPDGTKTVEETIERGPAPVPTAATAAVAAGAAAASENTEEHETEVNETKEEVNVSPLDTNEEGEEEEAATKENEETDQAGGDKVEDSSPASGDEVEDSSPADGDEAEDSSPAGDTVEDSSPAGDKSKDPEAAVSSPVKEEEGVEVTIENSLKTG